MKQLFIAMTFIFTLPIAFGQGISNSFTRDFWHPLYHGQRLSYCTYDGAKCGHGVAKKYCQAMGYLRASSEIEDFNVGLTHYISTQAVCHGWRCHGFKLIRCQGRLSHNLSSLYYYRSVRFVYPRFLHYRIDWCYQGRRQCGQRAAHSFCRRMGYRQAQSFNIERHVAVTRHIGSGELCFGNVCRGFSQITCFR